MTLTIYLLYQGGSDTNYFRVFVSTSALRLNDSPSPLAMLRSLAHRVAFEIQCKICDRRIRHPVPRFLKRGLLILKRRCELRGAGARKTHIHRGFQRMNPCLKRCAEFRIQQTRLSSSMVMMSSTFCRNILRIAPWHISYTARSHNRSSAFVHVCHYFGNDGMWEIALPI